MKPTYTIIIVTLVCIVSIGIGVLTYGHQTQQINLHGESYTHYTPSSNDKIICIYFDDGWSSILKAVPILDSYGYKASLAIIANYTSPQHPSYLSWSQIRSLSDDGFDIQCHTTNHLNLNTLSATQLQSEIVNSKQIFKAQGYVVSTLVYPSGLGYNNATVRSIVESTYSNARTTWPFALESCAYNIENDKYAITSVSLSNSVSLQQYGGFVSQAVGKSIVVITYHELDVNASIGITTQLFTQEMAYLHDNGFTVKLLNEVI